MIGTSLPGQPAPPFLERLAGGAGIAAVGVRDKLAGAPRDGEAVFAQDPLLQLVDLRLPPIGKRLLEPPLEGLGYRFEETTARDEWNGPERAYHLVRNDVGRRLPVVHVPKRILDYNSGFTISALRDIVFSFERGANLFVFSEGLQVLPSTFVSIMVTLWPQIREVVGLFVAWQYVEELTSLPIAEQEARVRVIFKLPAGASPLATDISTKKIRQLTNLLAGLPAFTDEDVRGRRVLAEQAGVRTLLGNFDYTGSPTTVAGDMIVRLRDHGTMSGHPDEHALGALLFYIYLDKQLAQADVAFVGGVITDYALLPSLPDRR